MPARQRPAKDKPTPPAKDVVAKLDPEHSEEDFLRDLERASTNRSQERLAEAEEKPSRRARGSSKT